MFACVLRCGVFTWPLCYRSRALLYDIVSYTSRNARAEDLRCGRKKARGVFLARCMRSYHASTSCQYSSTQAENTPSAAVPTRYGVIAVSLYRTDRWYSSTYLPGMLWEQYLYRTDRWCADVGDGDGVWFVFCVFLCKIRGDICIQNRTMICVDVHDGDGERIRLYLVLKDPSTA